MTDQHEPPRSPNPDASTERTASDLEREALRIAIGAVLFNTSNYPERAQRYLLGTDTGPLNAKLTDAVQAAGFRLLPGAPSDTEALLAKWDAPERPGGWNAGDEHHLATLVINALRASGSLQVEVTDEDIQRGVKIALEEGLAGRTWPEYIRAVYDAVSIRPAALGGRRVAVDPSKPTCGDVEEFEGACILPEAHEGDHWHSMFGEPRNAVLSESPAESGECGSCGETVIDECPASRRPCGHHCNHSWTHDHCDWCGKDFGPDDDAEPHDSETGDNR